MNSCTREEIIEAYIAPLRSAILVDDAFPRYDQLAQFAERGEVPPGLESSTAARIVDQCHRRSLVCDVENRAKEFLSEEHLARITRADLVVLDYHLTPGNDSDVLPALSILEALAESHHANLVVVYTKYDLGKALRDVFVRFRGIDKQAGFPEEYDGTNLEQWSPGFDGDVLFRHLAGDRAAIKTLIGDATGDLRNLGVQQKDVNGVVRAAVELWLQSGYEHVDAPDRLYAGGISRSAEGASTPWLHFKNVFVTFVSKLDEGADLIQRLEGALIAWNPSVLRLILSYARSRMQQRGFAYEQIVAGSVDRQIGLLYHALESEEPDETVRLRDMLRRLFDSVRRELSTDSAEFGARVIKQRLAGAGSEPTKRDDRTRFFLDRAREMSDSEGDSPVDSERVISALNAFLCSRDFDGSHLWAGTVFCDRESKGWWVCVAPTCEIVPRKPTAGTWQRDLYPSLPMLALRLDVVKPSAALMEATQAKHIFVQGPDGIIALRVPDLKTGQPRPETMILQDEGRVDTSRMFKAFAIVRGKNDVPQLQPKDFRVIAQLRSEYADRFLHQTGHHTSRIGVDFVPLGDSETPAE